MLLSRLASRAAASGTRALLARAAQRNAPRRLLSEKPAEKAAEKAAAPEAKPGWWSTVWNQISGAPRHRRDVDNLTHCPYPHRWSSAEFWGGLGALAGWGMTGAAIYDAQFSSPEKISMTMTPVMIIYSSLFCRWAIVVKPQNLLLAACHGSNVVAQINQMRRAVEYKTSQGKDEEVQDILVKSGVGAAALGGMVVAGPTLQSALVAANLGPVSTFAGAAAGPFTVHFWAPMSKWLISGASMMELDRPVEKISLAQYTALTLTGAFFSRYALLVNPINYMLCSVNVALFSSSAWHLGRKVKADYVD